VIVRKTARSGGGVVSGAKDRQQEAWWWLTTPVKRSARQEVAKLMQTSP